MGSQSQFVNAETRWHVAEVRAPEALARETARGTEEGEVAEQRRLSSGASLVDHVSHFVLASAFCRFGLRCWRRSSEQPFATRRLNEGRIVLKTGNDLAIDGAAAPGGGTSEAVGQHCHANRLARLLKQLRQAVAQRLCVEVPHGTHLSQAHRPVGTICRVAPALRANRADSFDGVYCGVVTTLAANKSPSGRNALTQPRACPERELITIGTSGLSASS
jgi:hypothetical protein